jgi:hypothetical protein
MIDKRHCPSDCPFLENNRTTDLNALPYHCSLFNCFLAVDSDVIRCEECLGFEHDVKNQGLNFISSYQNPFLSKQNTKFGFTRMPKTWQKRFVNFLKNIGYAVGAVKQMPLKDPSLPELLIKGMREAPRQHQDTPQDVYDIEKLLKNKMAENPELTNKQMNKLLTNLFKVLDTSEKNILQEILKNSNTADAFLKKFKEMPKNENLLKDLRRELEDFDREKEELEKRLQRMVEFQNIKQNDNEYTR